MVARRKMSSMSIYKVAIISLGECDDVVVRILVQEDGFDNDVDL